MPNVNAPRTGALSQRELVLASLMCIAPRVLPNVRDERPQDRGIHR